MFENDYRYFPTLREIRDMTLDELIGWSSYFQVINEEQEKEFEKAKRRR